MKSQRNLQAQLKTSQTDINKSKSYNLVFRLQSSLYNSLFLRDGFEVQGENQLFA